MRQRFVLATVLALLVSTLCVGQLLPPDEGGGPLEKLGWNTKECMLCKAKRKEAEQKNYSDSRGFGFCEKCGKKAEAFATVYSNEQKKLPTPEATFKEGKAYMEGVQKLFPAGWMNTDTGKTKALLLMTCFGNWGDKKKWEERWDDAVTLGLKKTDIER